MLHDLVISRHPDICTPACKAAAVRATARYDRLRHVFS
jgi:hypothetical protein